MGKGEHTKNEGKQEEASYNKLHGRSRFASCAVRDRNRHIVQPVNGHQELEKKRLRSLNRRGLRSGGIEEGAFDIGYLCRAPLNIWTGIIRQEG